MLSFDVESVDAKYPEVQKYMIQDETKRKIMEIAGVVIAVAGVALITVGLYLLSNNMGSFNHITRQTVRGNTSLCNLGVGIYVAGSVVGMAGFVFAVIASSRKLPDRNSKDPQDPFFTSQPARA